MEKEKHKVKKNTTLRKLDQLLKQQEHFQPDKKFNPGLVEFQNTQECKCKVVNFFGDVHTEVFTVKVSQNDKEVAVGCSNGEVKIYDIYQGKVMSIGNTSHKSGFPCTGLKWKPKSSDQFVTCNCDGTIKWYSRGQQTAYGHYQRAGASYLCCDYQALQEWCVVGTSQNTLQLFDNQTMKIIQGFSAGGAQQLNFNAHTNRIFSVKCLPEDPHVFFSGGWDSTVQIWDIRVKENSVRRICGPSVSADSLDYRNGVLLAGNYQNNDIAQLYDFKSGNLIENLDIKEPPNGISYCFSASFAKKSEHNLIGVSLSGSNKVKVLKDKKVVAEMKFQAAPLSIDFYRFNNKDFLIVGGVEGTIYAIKIKIY